MRLFTDQIEIAPPAKCEPKGIGWLSVGLWFLAVFGAAVVLLPAL